MSMSAADFIEKGLEFENTRENYRAISCYKKALELDPDNVTALVRYGEVLSYQNRMVDAMKCFEKVITLDPKNRTALEYRRLFGEKC